MSFELDVSKNTEQKAHVGLCDRGIIDSVPGKGLCVKAKPSDSALNILLAFNKFTAYKKSIYNSFLHTLNTQANIHFHLHDYDPQRFKRSACQRHNCYESLFYFYGRKISLAYSEQGKNKDQKSFSDDQKKVLPMISF